MTFYLFHIIYIIFWIIIINLMYYFKFIYSFNLLVFIVG